MKGINQVIQANNVFLKVFGTGFLLLMLAMLAGCGNDAYTGASAGATTSTTPGTTTNPVTGASVATIQLLTSSPSLGSSSTDSVTITAIVKDTNNNLMSGVDVVFSSNGGDLTVTQSKTSSTGVATATLTTASNPTNRTIRVTAVSGTVSSFIDIAVTGTTLSVSGATSLVYGDSATLTITAKDSDGLGLVNQNVAVSSANGNSLSSATVTTGTGGQASVVITATQTSATPDVITVTGLGTSATYTINVSSDQFTFTAPTGTALLNLDIGVAHTVIVNWNQGGVAVVGQPVTFSTTRGAISPSNTVNTDGNGNATIQITSTNAGPATITATTTSGPSASIQGEFVAVVADQLSIQADRTTIGPNGEQATLTAVVRDPSNNLVKNVRVNFTIYDDVSNGSISTPTDTTDSQGRASTIYTSTSATTAKDGVVIIASVDGQTCATPTDTLANALCATIYLTVAQNELFVVLGTANDIGETGILYNYPYSVLVTDSGGNAVANTTVVVTLEPELYATGWMVWSAAAGSWVQHITDVCPNEDINRDGILDAGEDTNVNGTLEPRNVATIPVIVTTDASGFAQFTIDYAKQFALWVNVTLTATAGVAGTESSSSVNFWLPASVTDMKSPDSPPSYVSPYGATSICDQVINTIPYAVTAEASGTSTAINVQWRGVTQAATYNIYRETGGNCPVTRADIIGASATKVASDVSGFFEDTTVTSTTSYCYAVTGNFTLGILTGVDPDISATEGPVSASSNIVVAP